MVQARNEKFNVKWLIYLFQVYFKNWLKEQ